MGGWGLGLGNGNGNGNPRVNNNGISGNGRPREKKRPPGLFSAAKQRENGITQEGRQGQDRIFYFFIHGPKILVSLVCS
jgi:hypothetical protein